MDRPVWMDAMGRCDSVGRRWRARVNEYDDGDGDGDGDDFVVFRFGGRGGANANDDETVATIVIVFGIISSRTSMRAFGWGDWGDDERRRRGRRGVEEEVEAETAAVDVRGHGICEEEVAVRRDDGGDVAV